MTVRRGSVPSRAEAGASGYSETTYGTGVTWLHKHDGFSAGNSAADADYLSLRKTATLPSTKLYKPIHPLNALTAALSQGESQCSSSFPSVQETRALPCFSRMILPTPIRPFPPHGLAHPPATSTHSAKQLPCFPSTSTISVSHLHLHPTPFSFSASHVSQYASSSSRAFLSSVVSSSHFFLGSCRAGAFAGQC